MMSETPPDPYPPLPKQPHTPTHRNPLITACRKLPCPCRALATWKRKFAQQCPGVFISPPMEETSTSAASEPAPNRVPGDCCGHPNADPIPPGSSAPRRPPVPSPSCSYHFSQVSGEPPVLLSQWVQEALTEAPVGDEEGDGVHLQGQPGSWGGRTQGLVCRHGHKPHNPQGPPLPCTERELRSTELLASTVRAWSTAAMSVWTAVSR